MTAIGFDNVARGTRAPESGSTSAGERRQSAGREGLSAGVQEVQTTRTSANVSVNGDFSDEAKEKLPEEPEAVVAASVSVGTSLSRLEWLPCILFAPGGSARVTNLWA